MDVRRNVHRRLRGEMSSVGRNAYGTNRPWGEMSVHGAKRPWGELSVGPKSRDTVSVMYWRRGEPRAAGRRQYGDRHGRSSQRGRRQRYRRGPAAARDRRRLHAFAVVDPAGRATGAPRQRTCHAERRRRAGGRQDAAAGRQDDDQSTTGQDVEHRRRGQTAEPTLNHTASLMRTFVGNTEVVRHLAVCT